MLSDASARGPVTKVRGSSQAGPPSSHASSCCPWIKACRIWSRARQQQGESSGGIEGCGRSAWEVSAWVCGLCKWGVKPVPVPMVQENQRRYVRIQHKTMHPGIHMCA